MVPCHLEICSLKLAGNPSDAGENCSWGRVSPGVLDFKTDHRMIPGERLSPGCCGRPCTTGVRCAGEAALVAAA